MSDIRHRMNTRSKSDTAIDHEGSTSSDSDSDPGSHSTDIDDNGNLVDAYFPGGYGNINNFCDD